jgi:hypothetical protein
VIELLQAHLPAPHYSLLSRRDRYLKVDLAATPPNKIKHLVIDAGGLKVYGEGGRKVRLHGADKRSTWRKLHIAMGGDAQQVCAALLTDKDVVDPRCLPKPPRRAEADVGRDYGDGAYDGRECYRAVCEREAVPVIPPGEGSTPRGKTTSGIGTRTREGCASTGLRVGRSEAAITDALL